MPIKDAMKQRFFIIMVVIVMILSMSMVSSSSGMEIVIVPIGEVPSRILDELAPELTRRFCHLTTVAEADGPQSYPSPG